MVNECIFCQLSQGKIKCHKIYEDKNTFAFLDIHPINPGHVLVIPKQHVAEFFDLDDDLYSKLWLVVKRISKIVNKVTKPKKVGVLIAGWDISHVHIHIVPMHDYHDLTSKSLLEGKRANPTDKELAKVAVKLTKEI